MITVKDIYDYIDSFAPFSQQQSYDNSGLCAGEPDMSVKRVLTALDITSKVVEEAKEKDCQLIISHHPVIFKGLKYLSMKNPAVALTSYGMAAVCAHTSFDSAQGGMNDILCSVLGFEILETLAYEEGKPIGYVCRLPLESSSARLASVCKKKLGCKAVRYTGAGGGITTVGVCSGSGGNLMDAAMAKGCQALITGDVKHSDFIAAENAGFCLIDAGHYYTENVFHRALANKLAEQFPELVIMQSESGKDPVSIV